MMPICWRSYCYLKLLMPSDPVPPSIISRAEFELIDESKSPPRGVFAAVFLFFCFLIKIYC
jgi:hypothetical protein